MHSESERGESLSALALCLERGSRDPAALAGLRPQQSVDTKAQPDTSGSLLVVLVTFGLVVLLGMMVKAMV